MFQVVRTISSTAVCIWWLKASFLKVNEGSLSYPVFSVLSLLIFKDSEDAAKRAQEKRQQLFPLRLTWQGNDEIKWNYRWVDLEEQGTVGKRAWRQKCHSCVRVVGSLPCPWSILFLHCSPFGKTSRLCISSHLDQSYHYKHTEMWQIIMLFATAIARGGLDECLFLVHRASLKCIILIKNTFPN